MPDETDPPLIVDPYRVLPLPIRPQGFQPIAWRNPEITEHARLVQDTKLSERYVLNIGR